jgi:hypothetical protein
MSRRITYPHVASTLALVLALGGGGAYAAGLAKNSVGSKQLKTGAVHAVDVKAGALTGGLVQDGSITGADVDESTLQLPTTVPPMVVEGPITHNATLSNAEATYATVTFTAPAAGFVRLEGEASFGAAQAAAAGGYIDALFYIDNGIGAYTLWGSGDPSGTAIVHHTASDVVAVSAGSHTVQLRLREHVTGGFSTLVNGKMVAEFFPAGSAQS